MHALQRCPAASGAPPAPSGDCAQTDCNLRAQHSHSRRLLMWWRRARSVHDSRAHARVYLRSHPTRARRKRLVEGVVLCLAAQSTSLRAVRRQLHSCVVRTRTPTDRARKRKTVSPLPPPEQPARAPPRDRDRATSPLTLLDWHACACACGAASSLQCFVLVM